MDFHIFGSKNTKTMVLIHGVLSPWQAFTPLIEEYSRKYRVLVPALSAHDEQKSEFISLENEAEQIERYCLENFGGEVYALCGFSMGGAIAYRLFMRDNLKITKLVIDGAPLAAAPNIAKKVMTANYLDIIEKSKLRDSKTLENFSKFFLPAAYLEDFLAIADNISKSSVENMISSVCFGSFLQSDAKSGETEIVFAHGTKANEIISIISAKRIKKLFPNAAIIRFSGAAHCECAVFSPEKWINALKEHI